MSVYTIGVIINFLIYSVYHVVVPSNYGRGAEDTHNDTGQLKGFKDTSVTRCLNQSSLKS